MKIFNGSLPDAKSFFTAQGLPCQLDYNPADHYIWETSVNIDDPGESMKKIEELFISHIVILTSAIGEHP